MDEHYMMMNRNVDMCVKDYVIKKHSKIVIWSIYTLMFCIKGKNNVKKIQSEAVYNNDFKTIKCMNYYIMYKDPI